MKLFGSLRAAAVLALLSLFAAAGSVQARGGETPVPQDDREFFVDETKLPFEELAGLPSTRLWGIDNEAGFRIEIPDNWNGELVMYTHGFRGTIPELTVDNPPLRPFFLASGYAWAASSYSKNYYDVRSGVDSTNSLWRYFRDNVGKPSRTYITGFSMGGHVIGAAIEQFPNFECPDGRRGRLCRRLARILGRFSGGVKYDGAAPFCGVMGDEALFDYFGDFGYVAETLAGAPSEFPAPPDYFDRIFLPTLFALYDNPLDLLDPDPLVAASATLNAQGEKLRDFNTLSSGGPRPLANEAFRFFQQLLFSFSGSDGTLDGVVSGNIYDNTDRVYELDTDPGQSTDEAALNAAILRVARDPGVNPRRFIKLERVPIITGRLSVPVISVHTTGDLFVPFVMQQIYAQEAADAGRSEYLVSRATRAIGHCEFSPEELAETFQDLVDWVETGDRPGGDDILDPDNVADPLFGCNYSRGSTATRPLAPCPL